jgi:hypothetical protein
MAQNDVPLTEQQLAKAKLYFDTANKAVDAAAIAPCQDCHCPSFQMPVPPGFPDPSCARGGCGHRFSRHL